MATTLDPVADSTGPTDAATPKQAPFQRKQFDDTRHRSLDSKTAIPISFPRTFGKSSTPLLVQLEPHDKHTFSKFDVKRDSGSIGRVLVVPGKRPEQSTGAATKTDPEDVDEDDALADSGADAGSPAPPSALRIDLKGDTFQGNLVPLQNAVMIVSIGKDEARVESVMHHCVEAKYSGNVFSKLQGDMVEGDVDVSKFTFAGDTNVNDTRGQKDESSKSKKRKRPSNRGRGKKKGRR